MGFALWSENGLAWAQGTHEYKPMGTAVISTTDLFRQKDFSPARRPPPEDGDAYVGLFASIGDLNAWLEKNRRAPRRLPDS